MAKNSYVVYSTEELIERSKKIFNDLFDYSETELIDFRGKAKFICKTHGVIEQTISNHLKGHGCKKCSMDKLFSKSIMTQQEVLNRFKKNIAIYMIMQYVRSILKVEIICSIHGSFWQTPNQHISGHGCKACAMEILYAARNKAKKGSISKFRKTTEQFICEATEVHGNKYDYSQVEYKTLHSKVKIICRAHGEFLQTPAKHIHAKHGCHKCFIGSNVSKASDNWLDWLDKDRDIKLIREYRLPEKKAKSVDAYDPETNTVYEFHGDFYHGNPSKFNANQINPLTKKSYGEIYQKTLRIEQMIKTFGYNLVTIWESDWLEFQKQNNPPGKRGKNWIYKQKSGD